MTKDERIEELEAAVVKLKTANDGVHPLLRKAQIDSLESQITELSATLYGRGGSEPI